MGQAIVGILTWLLSTVFSAAVMQFISSFLMFFAIQAFITWGFGGDILPDWATPSGFVNAMNTLKSGVDDGLGMIDNKTFFASAKQMFYWGLDFIAFEYCIATAINAAITRFLIRRIFK